MTEESLFTRIADHLAPDNIDARRINGPRIDVVRRSMPCPLLTGRCSRSRRFPFWIL